MKKFKLGSLLAVLIFLASATKSSAFAATVTMSAPATTPVINTANSFNINIASVSNFGGYQLHFTYNPAVIRIDSLTNSAYLGSNGGSIYTEAPTINATTGTVDFFAIILSGNAPTATSGTLATVNFTPLANGTSTINFTGSIVMDNLANTITSTFTSGTITVGTTTVTSTPVPTATTAPVPTATRTPTPTPTRTPTPIPGVTNTPVPTGSSTCPTTKVKGDANCDGKVDGIDYSKWLNSQCVPSSGQTCANYSADFNSDSRIDDTDLSIWSVNRV